MTDLERIDKMLETLKKQLEVSDPRANVRSLRFAFEELIGIVRDLVKGIVKPKKPGIKERKH